MDSLTTEANDISSSPECCENCQAPEGSRHPIGNFIVKLNKIDTGGNSKFLCSRCSIRAEVRTQCRKTKKNLSLFRGLKKRLFKK